MKRELPTTSGPTGSSGETPPAGAAVRVGVAGWDYADWVGTVYPAGRGRRFDRLSWVSRFVDVIEVNSTFYRPVSAGVAESWIRRTADRRGFRFTAKSHRSWTHDPDFPSPGQVRGTLDGLRPLRDADRFGALLLQFPQSFRFGPRARERIDRLLEPLDGWRPVIEVRHASWDGEEADDWFASRRAGWCVVDQPRVGRATVRPVVRRVGPTAYLRVHGRNAANWFRPDAGRDARYDYLYPPEQVRELAGIARRLADGAEELFVIQNNHFRGKALVNALQMTSLLRGGTPPAPEELVATYPEIAAAVETERTRLF